MWGENQKRTKIELILGTHDGSEFSKSLKVIFDKWNIITDLFNENGFLIKNLKIDLIVWLEH